MFTFDEYSSAVRKNAQIQKCVDRICLPKMISRKIAKNNAKELT